MKILGKKLKLPYTLSMIGLAKNVGKTTAMNFIIKNLPEGIKTGISSTGLDGEEYDSISGKPKPKIFLKKGSIAATTDDCLKKTSASYLSIEKTSMKTSMGSVEIIEALEDGYFEIAGPCTISELGIIRKKLINYGCSIVIFDGSINRKASSSPKICDGIIISAGLNAGNGIIQAKTILEFWNRIYSLNKFTEFQSKEEKKFQLYTKDGIILQSSDSLSEISSISNSVLFSKGAFTERIAKETAERFNNMTIVIDEPSSVFAEPGTIKKLIKSSKLMVKANSEIIAITLNPWSPSVIWNSKVFFDEMKVACYPHNAFDILAGLYHIEDN